MASASPLKDIEEKFCECSICLGEFKDPKLLPCLHRYCRQCLVNVIAKEGDAFNCPLCKYKCEVNKKEGVDTFKTDFLMKSVVEFIAFQKSFERDNSRECIGCSKTLKVTSYCFKCRGFLCDECHQQHITSKMFATHERHILNLKDAGAKKLTFEKLASLAMAPRCHIHPENRGQLLCGTCVNVVVCIPCTYGKHKGHDLQEVKQFAEAGREKLTKQISELKKFQPKLYELPKKVENVRRQLQENVDKATAKLKIQRKTEAAKIDGQIEKMKETLEQNKLDVENRKAEEQIRLTTELEERIRQLRIEYDGTQEKTNTEYDNESKQLQKDYDKGEGKLLAKRKVLANKSNSLGENINTQQAENKQKIQDISDHCDHTINRYKNFTATTYTILASNDDWTDAQCIPNLSTASEPLIEDARREFPELDKLSDITSSDLPQGLVKPVKITQREETVIDVEGMTAEGCEINGITGSCSVGQFVITGRFSTKLISHISVVNMKGNVLHQSQIDFVEIWIARRVCDSLSQFKIAAGCASNQVGIYDVRDGSYIKTNIRDVIKDWPVTDRRITCVATDPQKKYIIIGSLRCRDLLVFDDELNYLHTVRLPDVILDTRDIKVHEGKLLLCDESGRSAYLVTMEQNAKMVYKLPRYGPYGGYWCPISVCTDSNSSIYMLWKRSDADNQAKTVLLQYSSDGRKILTTRAVDDDSRCITTVATENGEKILLATRTKGKIFVFGLETESCD